MMPGTKKLLGPKALKFLGIAYTLVLTLLLLFPSTDVPDIEVPFLDKIGHVSLFAFLALIWAMYSWVKTEGTRARLFLILPVIFLYGIIIEVLQELFFQPRTGDIWDVVANFVGIVLGGLIFYVLRNIFIR